MFLWIPPAFPVESCFTEIENRTLAGEEVRSMENNSAISNMILKNAMVLQSQPKWTFSKNTCNTYEVRKGIFCRPGRSCASWSRMTR